MNKQIEEIAEPKEQEGLVKRIWAEERKTMGNYLASAGLATVARMGFSYFADQSMESDAAISTIATAIDGATFWGTFIPQLVYRDKEALKDEVGKYVPKKVWKKVAEYGSMIGFMEAAYFVISSAAQFALQKKGMDPALASGVVIGSAIAFFSAALPPIRYGLRQWSER